VAEQGTHKPLVVSSNLTLATLEDTAVNPVVFLLRGNQLLVWFESVTLVLNQYEQILF
jgi:hypothetical protein